MDPSWGQGMYWALEWRDEQWYICVMNVAVFWHLKLIVTNVDITWITIKKTTILSQNFIVNSQEISRLLVNRKNCELLSFIVTDECDASWYCWPSLRAVVMICLSVLRRWCSRPAHHRRTACWDYVKMWLSLIHIWRCRRSYACRSRW